MSITTATVSPARRSWAPARPEKSNVTTSPASPSPSPSARSRIVSGFPSASWVISASTSRRSGSPYPASPVATSSTRNGSDASPLNRSAVLEFASPGRSATDTLASEASSVTVNVWATTVSLTRILSEFASV